MVLGQPQGRRTIRQNVDTGRVNESDPLQRVSLLAPFYIIKVKRDTSVLVKCDFVLNAYFTASPLKGESSLVPIRDVTSFSDIVGDKLSLDKLSIINDEHGKLWELRTTPSSTISQSFTIRYSRKSNGSRIFSQQEGLGRSSYYPRLYSDLREVNAPSSPEQASHASERFNDGDGAIPSSSAKPSQTADQSEEQRFSYADCDGYTSKVRKTLLNRIKNLICIGA
ncbi:hypothetical protein C8Q75DRAFT_46949 [Abortiporus biennis]|nr:hypothetical protein C8Q75DRAFT_46949 [Abortiporus biennis]